MILLQILDNRIFVNLLQTLLECIYDQENKETQEKLET